VHPRQQREGRGRGQALTGNSDDADEVGVPLTLRSKGGAVHGAGTASTRPARRGPRGLPPPPRACPCVLLSAMTGDVTEQPGVSEAKWRPGGGRGEGGGGEWREEGEEEGEGRALS